MLLVIDSVSLHFAKPTVVTGVQEAKLKAHDINFMTHCHVC